MYEKTIWEIGDTITAEKLNKIENAIANAPSEGVQQPEKTVRLVNNSSYRLTIHNYPAFDNSHGVIWNSISSDFINTPLTLGLLPSFVEGVIDGYVTTVCLDRKDNYDFLDLVQVEGTDCFVNVYQDPTADRSIIIRILVDDLDSPAVVTLTDKAPSE